MADTYRVVKPLVITKKEDGSDLYLYEGGIMPEHASKDEIKRLSDGGFIEKLSAADAKQASAPIGESN